MTTQTIPFIISASKAESLAKENNVTPEQLLPLPAKKLARPGISDFHVGAAGLASDGRIFLGVNFEFLGLPVNRKVHAEQFMITNMALNGGSEVRLTCMAVSSAPCGHCRQFLQEVKDVSTTNVSITEPQKAFMSMKDLLPLPFGSADIFPGEAVPLVFEAHKHNLSLKEKNQNDQFQLISRALEAARGSHAPYTKCPSGVALLDSGRNVHHGMYIESAGFNPSMMPLQAALVAYMVNSGGKLRFEDIVGAVICELEGGKVSQEETAKLLLKHIAPYVCSPFAMSPEEARSTHMWPLQGRASIMIDSFMS